MLYIFKQLKKSLEGGYLVKFASGGEQQKIDVASEINEASNTGAYLKKNANLIKSYVESLDRELAGQKDGIIFIGELLTQESENAFIKILKTLGIDETPLNGDGIELNKVITKIDEFVGEAQVLKANTHTEIVAAASDSKNGNAKMPETLTTGSEKEKINEKYKTILDFKDNDKRDKDKVEALQIALTEVGLGYMLQYSKNGKFSNGIDRSWGNKTASALGQARKDYKQKIEQLNNVQEKTVDVSAREVVSGEAELGEKYKTILEFNEANDKGNKDKVTALQIKLKELGFGYLLITKINDPKEGVDGRFGQKTKRALEAAINQYKKEIQTTRTKVKQKQGETTEKTTTTFKKQQGETKTNTVTRKEKTIEETDGKINITFGTGKEDYLGLRENINKTSFDNIIMKMDFAELTLLHKKVMDANKKYKNNYTPFSSEMKKIFTEVGYTTKISITDWGIGGIELASLVGLVDGIFLTQQKVISETNWKKQMELMFDYNQDGMLDDGVHFFTEELQFVEAIEKPQNFENLLLNMGYKSRNDFNKKLYNNYFQTRKEFKDRLAIIFSAPEILNPGEMLIDPKALEKFNEFVSGERERIKKEVTAAIESNEKTKNLPQSIKDQITFQGIGLIVGARSGITANWDISELTNQWIDTFSVGFVHGIPGIGISKSIAINSKGKIVEDGSGRAIFTFGAINFVPYVGATGVINDPKMIKELEEQFPKKLPTKAKISMSVVGSPVGATVMAGINILNENTKAGMEAAKRDMGAILDKVFTDIQKGKTFEQSSFKGNKLNKGYYEMLVGLYKSNGGDSQDPAMQDLAIDRLKTGALENYARALHSKATGRLHLSNISAGVLMYVVGWIPFVGASFEYHSEEWEKAEAYGRDGEVVISRSLEAGYYQGEGDESYQYTEKITKEVQQFKDLFDSKTRTLPGAHDFMNPNPSEQTPQKVYEKRWAGLLKVVGGMKNSPNKTELQNYLGNVTEYKDKRTIVSILSQYAKRANDYQNGSLNYYKKNMSSAIARDIERRKGFNTNLGFNTDKYADELYRKLELGKANIDEDTMYGISFDATASKNVEGNKTLSGVDVLFNPKVLTIEGKPALVEITNNNDKEGFIRKMMTLPNITQKTKDFIAKGIKEGTIQMHFGKEAEGFDDRVYLTYERSTETTAVAPQINTYTPNQKTRIFSLTWVGEVHEWENDDTPTEEPTKDGKDATTNPGTTEPEKPVDDTGLPDNGGDGNVVIDRVVLDPPTPVQPAQPTPVQPAQPTPVQPAQPTPVQPTTPKPPIIDDYANL